MENKYRPANGTDGMIFMDKFCSNCCRKTRCNIMDNSMIFDKKDKQYPKQLVLDESGNGTCTNFNKERVRFIEKPVEKTPLFCKIILPQQAQ